MKLAQKIKVLFVLFTLPVSTLTVHSKSVNETEVKLSATENYGKLPLSFEANVGQSDRSVKFLSRGKGYTVFLTPIEAVLSLRGKEQHVLRMNLVGANADARVSGEQPLEGRVNYLIGNDRTKWRTGIPTFQRIHYADVWQGIDLVWYGTQTEMEYDFVVKPGSDVAQIGVRFEGAEKLRINENAFQRSGFCIGVCGLELDRRVDAFVSMLSEAGDSLLYSTFFGGSATASASFGRAFDAGNAIAIDSSNRIYITGETASNNLPTKHAFQWSRHSEFTGTDAFIAVFNPFAANGNDTLLYSSYYGGDGDEIGRGVAVDNDRNAYIVGSTASTDLETKSPASVPLRATFQGGGFDGFVAKVDTEADGNSSLTYSTYFGGNINDRVESVAVDAQQRAYITGASNSSPSSFPLRNAFDSTQTNGEAFVAKLNADGTALFYSSFLGGDNANTSNDGEEGLGITIDFGGNAYVTGRTTSGASFPSVLPLAGELQGTAFLAKIEATISNNTVPKVLYSTTFGGSRAKAEAIALDTRGNVYLAGTTTDGLTTTTGAFDTSFNGGASDAFVAKFSTTFNDTVGVFRPSANQFQLRNSNSTGPADQLITFGQAGDQPIVGDWNNSGTDKPGVFRPSTGQFILQFGPRSIVVVNFGQSGDLAVVGDWDGNGVDTPGVFNPSTGQWLLTNGFNGQNVNNNTPAVNFTFTFGQAGDTPLSGDWDGNDIDGVGLFRGGNSSFILSNGFQGTVDIKPFIFGSLGSKPIAGDWNGDGIDTVGVFDQNIGTMSLKNVNNGLNTIGDIVFNFGQSGDIPLAGDWDGKPSLP
ncbi:MAG TPA: SBBP repeat-containing protein [Pyrinomonadaceae bacterium]|nr:SBBP repeat-containing protein [Pyrinomonadaceae bacterium]